MYGNKSTQRTTTREHDVPVTKHEIELFHKLNKDETKIRESAHLVKATNAELRDFPNDLALILYAKSNRLKAIKRNVTTITSVGNAIGLLVAGGTSTIVGWLNIIRDNNTELARIMLPYFEPDYSIDQDKEAVEDKIVVSSNSTRGGNISDILQKFSVPEGVAVDIQEVYQKGPSVENITSIATHLFTKLVTKKTPTDSTGYEF
jgi:hypothetical protein